MNKYIVILGDHNEHALHERYDAYAEALRSIFPKVLGIQPHIFLIQSEKDLKGVEALLPNFSHLDGQALLFQIQNSYRGSALATRMKDLNQFFQE